MSNTPLNGLRIVDLTHEWAGPHAARLMADLGAEVIKVEYFRRMDIMRGPRPIPQSYNANVRFRQLARNKRSVTLDLKDPTDKAVLEDLVRISDAVISNSRPGVLRRLGFDYERLCELREDIILVSLSASGHTGPEASYAGYGGGIEATSGLQSLTSYDDGSEPRRIREMDVTNGIVAATALSTALLQRRRSGRGAWVDLSEIEAPSHALAGEHLLAHATNGRGELPYGNRGPEHSCRGCYRCQGDDAWIVISITSDADWEAVCDVAGQPDWREDERFTGTAARARHRDALDDVLAAWCLEQDKHDLMQRLQDAGVIAGAVLNTGDLHADPHLESRAFFRASAAGADDPPFPGLPFRMTGISPTFRPGPPLGEDNRYLVCELLGREDIQAREVAELDIGTDFDVARKTSGNG